MSRPLRRAFQLAAGLEQNFRERLTAAALADEVEGSIISRSWSATASSRTLPAEKMRLEDVWLPIGARRGAGETRFPRIPRLSPLARRCACDNQGRSRPRP